MTLNAYGADTVSAGLASCSRFRSDLLTIARRRGYDGAVYMHLGHSPTRGADYRVPIKPRNLVATGDFDEIQYMDCGYLSFDPLASKAFASYTPFEWILGDLTGDHPFFERLLTMMTRCGMDHGVVTPIQDYARGPGLLNIFAGHAKRNKAASDPGALMMEAYGLHRAAGENPDLAKLAGHEAFTAREIAVLRCAAIGQTEQETAMALSLSRRGVQFHLVRAMEKLGASNKTAAAALAVDAGLIRL